MPESESASPPTVPPPKRARTAPVWVPTKVALVKKVQEKAGIALLLRTGKGIVNIQMMRNMVLVDYFTHVKKTVGIFETEA